MDFHDAANIFPLDEEHLGELAKDIRAHGLQQAIERLDGKIIDGRRRYLACNRAGVEPKFRDVKVADPIAYVLSLNLHRRHLTPSQLSMVGARARKLYDEQAKARQKQAGERGREGGRGNKKTLPANLPEGKNQSQRAMDAARQMGDARDQVGKAVGVSGKTIDHATRVLECGVPELVKAVDEGRMAVSTAAILSADGEDAQREAVEEQVKRGRKYKPGPCGGEPEPKEPVKEKPEGEQRGVGVIRANEAINSLTRIPKNDPLRQRGLQLVKDWIRRNQ